MTRTKNLVQNCHTSTRKNQKLYSYHSKLNNPENAERKSCQHRCYKEVDNNELPLASKIPKIQQVDYSCSYVSLDMPYTHVGRPRGDVHKELVIIKSTGQKKARNLNQIQTTQMERSFACFCSDVNGWLSKLRSVFGSQL